MPKPNRSIDAIPVYLVQPDTTTAGESAPLVAGAQTYAAGGYRQMTGIAASTGLTTPPANTRRAIIQAEAQAIRWRDDGTAPTASVGMLIPAGGELRYDGSDMSAIKLIQVTTGAIANVAYYA